MKDRAGRDGRLSAASRAFIGEWFGVERPGFGALAFGADKAVRPAHFIKVAGACRVVGKPRGEGGSRHGTVVFPAARHENKLGTNRRAVKAAGRYL